MAQNLTSEGTPSAMDRLGQATEELGQAIDRLTSTLTPILLPSEADTNGVPATSNPTFIVAMADRVRYLTLELEEVRRRIDL